MIWNLDTFYHAGTLSEKIAELEHFYKINVQYFAVEIGRVKFFIDISTGDFVTLKCLQCVLLI